MAIERQIRVEARIAAPAGAPAPRGSRDRRAARRGRDAALGDRLQVPFVPLVPAVVPSFLRQFEAVLQGGLARLKGELEAAAAAS